MWYDNIYTLIYYSTVYCNNIITQSQPVIRLNIESGWYFAISQYQHPTHFKTVKHLNLISICR